MSPAARSVTLPRSFGQYELFDFIGKGGMAEIYLARQKLQLGGARLCVVKQILPGLAGDPQFSAMLVHEAKLAARLNHANVVQVLDLGREDGRLFIAMEYVEGFDLNDLLGRCSRAKLPLPFELAVHVVREALRGLDYAHRRKSEDGGPLGIVHRDVSPSNLLLSFDGEVKVCDFGIAHANDAIAAGAATHEVDEALRGKAGYMSPEQARGEAVDARADVFAAGIILWELIAGRRLYKSGDGLGGLLQQARRAEIPELPRRGLPEEDALRAVVARALSIDRGARHPSAAAMSRDLDDYVLRAKLMPSALQLGGWLTTTFGAEIIARRRARERAMSALEKGPPLLAEPIAPASVPAAVPADPPSSRFDHAAAGAADVPSGFDRAAAGAADAPSPLPADLTPKAGKKMRAPAAVAFLAVGLVALAAALLAFAMR